MITKRDSSLVTFLRTVPVFHDLKGSNFDLLLDFLEEQTWDQGQTICFEGELGRTMYILRAGEVEVMRKAESGNNVPIVKLGPGETFGEMTLVELQPRSATVIVRSKKATTFSLTNLDLWNLYKADHYAYVIILQNICRMLSRRLRKADSRIVEFVESGAAKKAAPAKKPAAKKPAKKKK